MAHQTETPDPARQAAQTRAIDAILSGADTEGGHGLRGRGIPPTPPLLLT